MAEFNLNLRPNPIPGDIIDTGLGCDCERAKNKQLVTKVTLKKKEAYLPLLESHKGILYYIDTAFSGGCIEDSGGCHVSRYCTGEVLKK